MTREDSSRAKAHQSYHLADGTRVPSVTTILRVISKGDYLITWANGLGLDGYDAVEYRKAQASVGTLGHALIQAELRGETLDTYGFSQEERDRAENVLRSFRSWRRKVVGFEPLLVEEAFVSETARYGGTIDLYARVGGLSGIIDVKSSNDIYDEHHYQTAGYRRLMRDAGHQVDFTAILRCGRDSGDGYNFTVSTSADADEKVFEAAHLLYLSISARDAELKNLIPMKKSNRTFKSVPLVLGGRGSTGKEAPVELLPAIAGNEDSPAAT